MRINSFGRALARVCGAASSLAWCASPASATARNWATGSSGNWNAAGLWSPTGSPSSSADTATIAAAPVSTPYIVTVSNGFTIGGLTLNQAQATLFIGGGGQLAMANGAAALVSAGKLTINGGSLAQAGSGSFTLSPGATLETVFNVNMPAAMTYALNGSIVMSGTLQGFGTGFTNGGSMTLTGSGLAWLSTPAFTNNGTVTADATGGGRRLQTAISNGATGSIVMNADTEWQSGPHSNSGAVTIAKNTTMTVRSFAVVNQDAGNFLVGGNYTHQNGAFNMTGGTLTVEQSFFKDGGTFAYTGGTIVGTPTLHNATLTLGPAATNAADFLLHGPSNGLSGVINSNLTLRVEATDGEAGGLSAGFGDMVNYGTIVMAPTATQQASLTAFGGGGLLNHGVLTAEGPNGPGPGSAILSEYVYNFALGRLVVRPKIRWALDVAQGAHTNQGSIVTDASAPPAAPGLLLISPGSQSTFTQEAGSIQNGGSFVVGQGNTFQFAGGECTGNPIELDDATLSFGPDAGAGSFRTLGDGTIILADEIGPNQSVEIAPDPAQPGSDGVATWSPAGFVTPLLNGTVTLSPQDGLNARLNMQQTLVVQQAGVIAVNTALTLSSVVINVNNLALTMGGRLEWAPGSRGSPGDADARGGAGTVVTLIGDYTQEATGTLAPKIRGAGESDRLDVAGEFGGVATLGGALEIGLGGAYVPAWGDSATVMTYALHLGDFATFTAPALSPGLRWWRSAGATAYTVGARHVADTNHDGHVDFLDLNNVLSYYGQSAPAGSAASIGDANTDGVVDFLDLNQVLGAFGTNAP